MFSSNVNSETGIRYGVIDARKVPFLDEEIRLNGESISYQNYEEELTNQIRYALTEEDGDLKAVLDYYWMSDHAQQEIIESVNEHQGKWSEEEIEEISQQVMDELANSGALEFDEEEYEYETEAEKYLLSYLGGAPLIWVMKSPFLTKARLCSPCIPNAGNLDSPDPNGYTCYAVEPDYFDGECPYKVIQVSESIA
jgi:hypothetical protein